jgi:hypothetical protein
MFAKLAPKLIENGWTSLLPVSGKRPLHPGWNLFNQDPPGDAQIRQWQTQHPDAGIGLAFGPDNVIGVDLDWVEADIARKASEVTLDICGSTDFIRIGMAPKSMLFYRAAPGLVVHGKAFGGYEIFSKSGQAILFGIHPGTGRPYRWLKSSPEDGRVSDLPPMTQSALEELHRALAPYCLKSANRPGIAGGNVYSGAANHRSGEFLKAVRAHTDPLGFCRTCVLDSLPGDRYPTATNAIFALVTVGYSDDEIRESVVTPYLTLFDGRDLRTRKGSILSYLRWARLSVGRDAATLVNDPKFAQMQQNWDRRWGRL